MLLLLGGGGHCRVVIEAIRLGGGVEPVGILDLSERVGDVVAGVPIVGIDEDLERLSASGHDAAFVALGMVGLGTARQRLYGRAVSSGYTSPVIVHPQAIVSPTATLGSGTFVGAGAVVGSGCTTGLGCIVNSGAIVDHDCSLGDFVHIAPGAALSGGARVGARSLVGTGASLIQSVAVGSDSIVGAGSTVVGDIPDGVVACGTPCRVSCDD